MSLEEINTNYYKIRSYLFSYIKNIKLDVAFTDIHIVMKSSGIYISTISDSNKDSQDTYSELVKEILNSAGYSDKYTLQKDVSVEMHNENIERYNIVHWNLQYGTSTIIDVTCMKDRLNLIKV